VFEVDGTTLRGGQVFAEIEPGVPDGLRVDQDGNVWTSAMDGVRCLDPDGCLLGKIVLPMPTANLCFGGAEGTDMFITASDTVWRVRTTRRDAATLLRNRGSRT
jgi:gluconolactonase